MRSERSLLQSLSEMGAGEIVARRCEATLCAALLRFAGGRQVLVVERSYRFGLRLIREPRQADVDRLLAGDLQKLWSSERGESVAFVV